MENKENQKRARNFTDFDKHLLFEIVQNYLNMIENKKTDATNVKVKNETWELIAQQFNASCQSGVRSAKQLHALYDGMKKKARKNLHDDKKETYKTGGGLFTPKSDILDMKIVDTLGVQFRPLSNPFDSSSDYLKEKDVIVYDSPTLQVLEAKPLEENVDTQLADSAAIYVVESESKEDNVSQKVKTSDPVAVEPTTSKGVIVDAAGRTPMKKKKFIASTPRLSEKKETLSIISDRLVSRKNFKDEADAKIYNKKLKILDIEEKIKTKDLEIKSLELQNLKEECEFLKSKRALELQLLEENLKIKKITYESKI